MGRILNISRGQCIMGRQHLQLAFLAFLAFLGVAGCAAYVQQTPPPATAPAAAVALSGAAVMVGVGDIARCDSRASGETATLVDSIVRANVAEKVDVAVFTLGDNAYTSGTVYQFANCFAPTWGDTAKMIMQNIHPAPGNHEYHSAGADPYYAYFGKSAGSPGKGHYSYSIGTWHAVVINSEIVVNSGFSSPQRLEQEEWLRRDLKDNAKECTVAYWHHPRFSSGTHGSDARLASIWRILYENDADLVMVGHDHNYERFLQMTPEGVADTLRGIVQIVAGTGGATLRPMQSVRAGNSAFQIAGRYGVLVLTLGAREFRSAFVETNGAVWDPSG